MQDPHVALIGRMKKMKNIFQMIVTGVLCFVSYGAVGSECDAGTSMNQFNITAAGVEWPCCTDRPASWTVLNSYEKTQSALEFKFTFTNSDGTGITATTEPALTKNAEGAFVGTLSVDYHDPQLGHQDFELTCRN